MNWLERIHVNGVEMNMLIRCQLHLHIPILVYKAVNGPPHIELKVFFPSDFLVQSFVVFFLEEENLLGALDCEKFSLEQVYRSNVMLVELIILNILANGLGVDGENLAEAIEADDFIRLVI